ncbi:tetratricopeptide repeat protein [bacterium]|nr:tetratricopeptide repeat protein [bacterium]
MNSTTTPETPASWALRGQQFKREGNHAAALDAFASARLLLLAEMGDCFANLGRYQDAAVLYEELLDFNPSDEYARLGLGVALLLSGSPDQAETAFSAVLRAKPDQAKAHCGRGMALAAMGRNGEAVESFARALDSDPENLTALHELVKSAYVTNSFDEAAARLESYLMYHPGDPDMLFSLAGILYKSSKYGNAHDVLERLLALSPGYEGAKELLVKIGEAANSRIGEKAANDTTNPGTNEAKKFKDEGKFAEALACYSRIAEQGDRSVLADLGDCLANLGRTDDAAAAYHRALEEDGNDPKALVGLGVVSMLQGQEEQAAAWFDRALTADGTDARALCGLGMVRNLQNKHNEAIDLFAGALDADPEQLSALNGLVGCSYQLGKFEEAERRLGDYLLYHPADLDMLFSLAGIRYKMGKPAAALESIETVLLFEPAYQGGTELLDKIRQLPAA